MGGDLAVEKLPTAIRRSVPGDDERPLCVWNTLCDEACSSVSLDTAQRANGTLCQMISIPDKLSPIV